PRKQPAERRWPHDVLHRGGHEPPAQRRTHGATQRGGHPAASRGRRAGAPHSREDGPGPDHGRSPTRSPQAPGGPSVANTPNGWFRQGPSAEGRSTMSDMTALLVAVMAFAVAAAARLADRTETHSAES